MKADVKYLQVFVLTILALSAGIFIGAGFDSSAQEEGKVFELRTYTTTEGNLDNLHARFRDHTIGIFNKHGMKSIGYWTPTGEDLRDNTLIYILEHPSQQAADSAWQAFINDPEWQQVSEASNANGPILAGVERRYMRATDYSPIR